MLFGIVIVRRDGLVNFCDLRSRIEAERSEMMRMKIRSSQFMVFAYFSQKVGVRRSFSLGAGNSFSCGGGGSCSIKISFHIVKFLSIFVDILTKLGKVVRIT